MRSLVEFVTTCSEAVIASERSERGDLFVRSNWSAFAPHAFVRFFGDTYHRYAVLELDVAFFATTHVSLRGFDVANGEGNADDADVLGDKIINLSQRRRERREIC
ncbi:MAG: hypothetical protein Q9P14_16825 [candidate division KSB1 bacterium]|nr:hypothetical protein [candidate division KSB1 bacterium]